MGITVKPVTPARWKDFERLFASKGCPGYCWCMPYRHPKSHEMTKDQKRGTMRSLVAKGTPIGVLAYDGGEAVAWCSIAPRETFPKLERSRVMPRVDAAPTWTVTCFFVRRDHRGQGLSRELLSSAIAYAKRRGAHVVEAYPFDTAGITSRHMGHSSLFRAAGFRRRGRRWARRLKADATS